MAENTLVKMQTSEGDFYIELFNQEAPLSVANFLSYAQDGFYNDTLFHRVISTFMIQGGGFDQSLTKKPTKAPIKNEADNGLKNLRGTIAMARLPDPHSATAQFFINVQDNPTLDFKGTEAIEKVKSSKANESGNQLKLKMSSQQATQDLSQAWGYAVFGKVVKGMNVVDNIRFTKTGAKLQFNQNVPIENVVILAVEVVSELPE